MLPFIIRRLLWMVVLLLIISFLTFLIFFTLLAWALKKEFWKDVH